MDSFNIHSIGHQLTSGTFNDVDKLQAIATIKKNFKQSLGNVKLESLLTYSSNFNGHHFRILDSDFLLKYGTALLNYLGKCVPLNSKLLQQLEYILIEMKQRDRELLNTLIFKLWNILEQHSIIEPLFLINILDLSRIVIESTIISWLKGNANMDYFSCLSAKSPEMFQAVSALLHQILIKSEGKEKIIKIIALFVDSVLVKCKEMQQNFLKLYPRDCSHLVSLLMISPGIFPSSFNKSVSKTVILNLILEKFIASKNKTLLLLSHYPSWIPDFKIFIDNNICENNFQYLQ